MRNFILLVLFFATHPGLAFKVNKDIPPCGEHEWTCRDGTCIDFNAKCNGTAECRDGSDEIYPSCMNNRCPDNLFRCAYGACIDPKLVCDDQVNCNDWSDETNPNCYTTNIVLGKFRCDDGEEISLSNLCDGIPDCLDSSDETIKVCTTQTCPAFMYQCQYGACVEQGSNCDGVDDCADGSDEIDDICKWRPLSEIKLELPAGNCILPAYDKNGGYTVLGAPNAIPGQGYDAVSLEVFCYDGYGFLGDTILNCSKGIWSGRMPKCKRACKLIQDIDEYICLNSLGDKQSMRTCNEYEPEGVLASPQCMPPLHHPDAVPKYMKCVEGEWDYFITCTTGACTFPATVSVLKYSCVTFNGTEKIEEYCEDANFLPEGTLIQPVCKEHYYQLEETSNIAQCMANSWTFVPKCMPACGKWNNTTKGKAPWHAGVYSKLATPYKQICGGSLINNRIVVSAAHCFWTDKLQPAANYAVAVGKLYRDWDHAGDNNAQKSNISDIKIPRNFAGISNNLEGDLALVFLSTPIEFNNYINPVCFDFDISFDLILLHGRKAGKVPGWGPEIEEDSSTSLIKDVAVSYILTWMCFENPPEAFQEYMSYDKICAEPINGKALCSYDAGSGLVYPDPDSPTDSLYLRGVFIHPPSNTSQCNMESIYIFTHLNEYRDFIKDNISGASKLWKNHL